MPHDNSVLDIIMQSLKMEKETHGDGSWPEVAPMGRWAGLQLSHLAQKLLLLPARFTTQGTSLSLSIASLQPKGAGMFHENSEEQFFKKSDNSY